MTCPEQSAQVVPTDNPDPDGDGYLNTIDLCPNTYGTVDGCPDNDGDGVANYADACPAEYGSADNAGCPESTQNDSCNDGSAYDSYNDPCNHDEDSDGLYDSSDDCPSEYGTIAANGCPDSDSDGIPDSSDSCPFESGNSINNGCPDNDNDGIINSEDACPNTYGTVDGCPDNDNDGIINSEDACPNTYGVASNNGCPAVTFSEDCIAFNPNDLDVDNVNGNWTIVEGGRHLMMSFGSSQSEANQAYNIIQHYGANDTCYVGRPYPSLTYLLVNDNAPVGSYSGEDCIYFNHNNIEVTYVSGRWKIVEGSHWILDFDQLEDEARTSHAILQHYDFSYICFVGRPGASLTYFRR